MKDGTIYSIKAGGRKHYLQVILKKDLTGGYSETFQKASWKYDFRTIAA